jgi:hypothetical protein
MEWLLELPTTLSAVAVFELEAVVIKSISVGRRGRDDRTTGGLTLLGPDPDPVDEGGEIGDGGDRRW